MAAEGLSSSASATVSAVTVRSELPSTLIVSSDSSTLSSSGVSVKLPVPLVSPSAMVMVKSRTSAKSTASAFPLPDTVTVIVVSSVRAPASRVAITAMSVAPSLSDTRGGCTVSAMLEDVASSSVSSTSVPFTVMNDVPVTDNVSSSSSTSSLIGVSVKVAVPLLWSAAIVIVKSCTSAKSTAPALPLPATLTVISVASVRALPSRVAVTSMSVAPSSSETRAGDAVSVIWVDATSSSRIFPSARASPISAPIALDRRTSNISCVSSITSSSRGTRIVCSVTSVANVSVPVVSV